MDVVTIRTADMTDLAAIDALLSRSYPRVLAHDYPPSVLVLALPLLSRAQPVLVTSGRYYVAETADGRVLGAGGWSRAAPGPGACPTSRDRSSPPTARHRAGDPRAKLRRCAGRGHSDNRLRFDADSRTVLRGDGIQTARRGERGAPARYRLSRNSDARPDMKKAGEIPGPSCFPFCSDHSRLPRNCSRNMNMLMKSR